MKQEKLAQIIKDAVLSGMNAANEQWKFVVMSQQNFLLEQGKQNLQGLQEGTRQMKTQQEIEMLRMQHEEKQEGLE